MLSSYKSLFSFIQIQTVWLRSYYDPGFLKKKKKKNIAKTFVAFVMYKALIWALISNNLYNIPSNLIREVLL